MLAHSPVRPTSPRPAFPEVRLHLDRPREVADCLIGLMEVQISIAPAVPGPGVVRLQADRPGLLAERLLPLAKAAVGTTAVLPCFPKVRLQFDGLRVVADRL